MAEIKVTEKELSYLLGGLRRRSTFPITEKQFSQMVVDVAHYLGWKVYRTWFSLHSPAGYPDLCLVRLSRLVFAEVKSEKGKLTEAQQEWLNDLEATGKVEVYCWKPSNFEEIVECLR